MTQKYIYKNNSNSYCLGIWISGGFCYTFLYLPKFLHCYFYNQKKVLTCYNLLIQAPTTQLQNRYFYQEQPSSLLNYQNDNTGETENLLEFGFYQ